MRTGDRQRHPLCIVAWHGPYYFADRSLAAAKTDPGPGRTGWITATQVSTRGGFGSFGRALRAVG